MDVIHWKFIKEVMKTLMATVWVMTVFMLNWRASTQCVDTEIVSLEWTINDPDTLNLYLQLLGTFSHTFGLPLSCTHISVYYKLTLQLPVDEILLLVASSPLAGFKPGSVWPRRGWRAIYKCDDCCPVFSHALCKKKNSQWPPYLPPWHPTQHPTGPRTAPARAPVACT